ncbi:MAG: hypothetical protein KDA59_25350 [Planctomycetales bacterium]|nr:hypothetical protein [Planctomycetales bacterium]
MEGFVDRWWLRDSAGGSAALGPWHKCDDVDATPELARIGRQSLRGSSPSCGDTPALDPPTTTHVQFTEDDPPVPV